VNGITIYALLLHPLFGALKLSLRLLCIIVPLLVIFELIRALPFWSTFQSMENGRSRMEKIGFSPYTLIPLFTGIFLGIAYGAGVIIKISKEKSLNRADLWLLGLFLATCHAVVEDTLIFVVVGGVGRWIIIPRILLACFLSALLILMVWHGKAKQISP
jgi:hypothetical protein